MKTLIKKTTCAYCGVGCGLEIVRDGARLLTRGDKEHPSTLGNLCQKGGTLGQTLDQSERVLFPRVMGETKNWGQATDFLAKQFQELIQEHGPDSIALYVSGQMLTEDYYVANKFMKGYVGSANIDTNSRLCMASTVVGHKMAFGTDTVPACYEDIDLSDLNILIGSNMAYCHPVLYQRLIKAKETRKTSLVVIDPRKTESASQADIFLPIKPGTDVVLFNGLLNFLVENDGLNQQYLEANVEGFEETIKSVAGLSITKVAELCQVNEHPISRFYNLFLQTERTLSFFSQGVNQSSQGTEKVLSILNCHLATGRVGLPGSSPFSLTGQNNAMGGREVGGLANQLAAHMDFSPENLDTVKTFWNSPRISAQPGLKAIDLFEKIHSGDVKAVWIMATNPLVSLPDSDFIEEALDRCSLVVVSESFKSSDTLRKANVILPASSWGEKSGMVTNSERRISRQRGFSTSPGFSMPDWWIICEVAKKMGFDGFQYTNPAQIFREHAALTGFRNTGRSQLDISGLKDISDKDYEGFSPAQWPIREDQKPSKRLFSDGKFDHPSKKARMIPTSYKISSQLVDNKKGFILTTGRIKDQWHTMTRTSLVASLGRSESEPYIEIHPADLEDQNISVLDTSLLRVKHETGQFVAKYKENRNIHRGTVFVPIHWTEFFGVDVKANRLTKRVTDPRSGQPEFKLTPVNVEAYVPKLHGFVALRSQSDKPQEIFDQYIRIPEDGFHCYRFSSNRSVPLSLETLEELFPDTREDDWIIANGGSQGFIRAASLDEERLNRIVYLSASPQSQVNGIDLSPYFKKKRLAPSDRIDVLGL